MYVKGPSNSLLTLNNAASSSARGGWQAGQLLKAMVVSVDPQGTPTLEINGRQVTAQGGLALRPGQMLQLEVMDAGTTPLLKVLNPPSNPAEAMSRGVRESLPQQQPLTQVLNSLQQLAQAAKGDAGQQLRALSRQLMEQLPQLQQLHSGAAVKQAVEDSGHFLESKLQQLLRNSGGNGEQPQAQLGRDLKAGILRLLQAVRTLQQQTGTESAGSSRAPTAAANPEASSSPKQAPSQTSSQTTSQATNPATAQPARGDASQAARLPPQANPSNPQANPPPTSQAQGPQTQGQPAANGAAQGGQQTGPQAPPSPNPQTTAQAGTQSAAAAPRTDNAAPDQHQVQQQGQQPVQQQTQTHNANTQQTQAQAASHTAAQDASKAGMHSSQQQLESGLARIQFNQLHSLQQSENQLKPSWLLEIPIRQAEGRVNTLQLEIQRDREDQGEDKRGIWSISLSFDLQELGPVRAGLTLVGEKQVGVNLWTARASTAELFQQHMEQLRNGMQEAGLYVSRVGVQQGIPESPPRHKPFADNSLVDVKA